MTEEHQVRCIICPLGCLVSVVGDDQGAVRSVEGHQCKEGERYALDEYRNPVRVLTATVLTAGSSSTLLPVRSNGPILKTRLLEGMRALARIAVRPPVKAGDVIIPNFLETEADLIATGDLPHEDNLA